MNPANIIAGHFYITLPGVKRREHYTITYYITINHARSKTSPPLYNIFLYGK